jgi:hypothetical protein
MNDLYRGYEIKQEADHFVIVGLEGQTYPTADAAMDDIDRMKRAKASA